MTEPAGLVLLDTGVVLHALRDSDLWKQIDADHQLLARRDRPLIPIVCIGELIGLGRMNNWGSPRLAMLEELLTNLIVVDIRSRPVLEKYGEIKAFLRGKEIGQNDIWVAAIASVTGAHLLTCDPDFHRIEGTFLNQTYYDPGPRKPK